MNCLGKRRCVKGIALLVFLFFALSLWHVNFGYFSPDKKTSYFENDRHFIMQTAKGAAASAKKTDVDECTANLGTISGGFLYVINLLLLAVFSFISLLAVLGGIILDWSINPNNFKMVVDNSVIYTFWGYVRDTMNLFFILVLLFSAFATIFQSSKYHLIKGKILLYVILMALLVNFSYPISRFIVDTANITMYYFYGEMFPNVSTTSGVSAMMGDMAEIKNNLKPADTTLKAVKCNGATLSIQIIAAIVFMAIFGMTMLLIGILMIVRLVVIAVLIFSSPVGFVGNLVPSLKKYADDWWSALFKQSFFGPIMVFMIYMAMKMMKAMNEGGLEKSMRDAMKSIEGGYSNIIVAGTSMAIPIVILWVGFISAQKMGAVGASMATKYVKKIGKAAALFPLKASGVYGGAQAGWKNFKKTGKIGGAKVPFAGSDAREEREAKYAGFISGGPSGWKTAKEDLKSKKINEKVKENEDTNVGKIRLKDDLDGKNGEVDRLAAVRTMLKKNLIDDADDLARVLNASSGDNELVKKVINELPKDLTDSVITNAGDLHKTITAVKAVGGTPAQVNKLVKQVAGKIKGDDNSKILADYDVAHGQINRDGSVGTTVSTDAAYISRFNLNPEKMASQRGLDYDGDAYLQNYIKSLATPIKQAIFEKLKTNDKTDWKNNGLI